MALYTILYSYKILWTHACESDMNNERQERKKGTQQNCVAKTDVRWIYRGKNWNHHHTLNRTVFISPSPSLYFERCFYDEELTAGADCCCAFIRTGNGFDIWSGISWQRKREKASHWDKLSASSLSLSFSMKFSFNLCFSVCSLAKIARDLAEICLSLCHPKILVTFYSIFSIFFLLVLLIVYFAFFFHLLCLTFVCYTASLMPCIRWYLPRSRRWKWNSFFFFVYVSLSSQRFCFLSFRFSFFIFVWLGSFVNYYCIFSLPGYLSLREFYLFIHLFKTWNWERKPISSTLCISESVCFCRFAYESLTLTNVRIAM